MSKSHHTCHTFLSNGRIKVTLLFAIMAILTHSVFATTVTVQIGNSGFTFSPSTANISVNDTVQWTWADSGHSTTGDTFLWDSGVQNFGNVFSRQFTTSGTFPYHCSQHQSQGMTGSIVVTIPNTPPVVSVTNPASGAIYSAPAIVKLKATASDPGGSVTNVKFLQGLVVLTNQTLSPYAFTVSNLTAGFYIFSAIATNSISINVVNPVSITLSAPAKRSATNSFNYSANVGLNYLVQRSTNITVSQWTSLITNVATNALMPFREIGFTNLPAYYRVGRLPNP